MDNGSGFSLLEVIVVLSIASILAGTGVLAHQMLRPRLNLSMAARQLMMDLRVARMRTAAEHVNYRIIFRSGGASYQTQRKSTSGYRDDGPAVPLPQGIVIADCTGQDQAIGFVPRGSAGNFGTVTIRNGNGDVRRVSVNIAGQIRVY